jgi:hypothetical protein
VSSSTDVLPTRKSIETPSVSAILITTSMEGFTLSLSYLPMMSPEVPAAFPSSLWEIPFFFLIAVVCAPSVILIRG